MTVFRCAEDQSLTGIHDTLEFLHVIVMQELHRGGCYILVINA